jgi:hypothetical protein
LGSPLFSLRYALEGAVFPGSIMPTSCTSLHRSREKPDKIG